MLIARTVSKYKISKFDIYKCIWAPCSCPHSLTGLDGAHGMHFIPRSLLRVLTKDLIGTVSAFSWAEIDNSNIENNHQRPCVLSLLWGIRLLKSYFVLQLV